MSSHDLSNLSNPGEVPVERASSVVEVSPSTKGRELRGRPHPLYCVIMSDYGSLLHARDLETSAFACCPNQEPLPYKCSACGLPMVYCLECSTQYPDLADTTRYGGDFNATDSTRPSHKCPRCGYTFEWAFTRNPAYAVTRAEWIAAGHGHLLAAQDDTQERLPIEIEAIPWRSPWMPVGAGETFEARVAKEAGRGHPLHEKPTIAVGRRLDQDDFLFYLPKGPALLAVVHLTYSSRTPEPDPRFPHTMLYESVRQWIDECLIPDAEQAAK
jgi:DNA-directed RNA polymerase subunit RPC12/RpoP